MGTLPVTILVIRQITLYCPSSVRRCEPAESVWLLQSATRSAEDSVILGYDAVSLGNRILTVWRSHVRFLTQCNLPRREPQRIDFFNPGRFGLIQVLEVWLIEAPDHLDCKIIPSKTGLLLYLDST